MGFCRTVLVPFLYLFLQIGPQQFIWPINFLVICQTIFVPSRTPIHLKPITSRKFDPNCIQYPVSEHIPLLNHFDTRCHTFGPRDEKVSWNHRWGFFRNYPDLLKLIWCMSIAIGISGRTFTGFWHIALAFKVCACAEVKCEFASRPARRALR